MRFAMHHYRSHQETPVAMGLRLRFALMMVVAPHGKNFSLKE